MTGPPPPPDRRRSALRGALVVAGGLFACALLLIGGFVGLRHAGGWLAAQTPFAWEVWAAEQIGGFAPEGRPDAELDALGRRVAAAMDLPEEIEVSFSRLASEERNAFATIGGRIVAFEGLIEALEDERALAFVLAHEIAHVEERHVARSIGGRLLFALAVSATFGDAGALAALADFAGGLDGLRYGRAHESEADARAAEALIALYGEAEGAALALRALDRGLDANAPNFLQSHPDIGDRIAAIEALARERGWPPIQPAGP